MIDIKIHGANCTVPGPMKPYVERELMELCRYRKEGIDYADSVKMGEWDGYTRLFNSRRFPVGLLDRVMIALELMDEDFRLKDLRPDVKLAPRDPIWELHDYQKPIIASAIERERGVIQAPTGAGKTVIMMHMLSHYGLPSLVVVPATELIDQTLDKMARCAGVLGTQISTQDFYEGVPGSRFAEGYPTHTHTKACPEECPVLWEMPWYVVTWQTMNSALKKFTGRDHRDERRNLMDFLDSIDVVCGDEIHYAGAEKVYSVFGNIPARYRFGFSATPYRTDGADLKMHGACGDILKGISATELIETGRESGWTKGLVPPIIHWFKPGISARYIDGGWQDVYRRYVVENRERNMQLADKAIDLADAELVTLVMCTQIEHGEILQAMMPGSEFINGTRSKKKRRELSKRFREGDIPIMVSSSVWNVGVDFPVIEAMVMAGPYKSAPVNNQRIGRGLRVCPEIEKTKCVVIETMDEVRYMSDWSHQRFDTYSKEKGFIHKGVKMAT